MLTMNFFNAIVPATPRYTEPKQRKMRVIRRRSRDDEWQESQYLQEKHWWGWKTIDQEEVPRFVTISLGTYGDTGGWVSKFTVHGRFGRDGVIHPYETEEEVQKILEILKKQGV